MRWLIFLALVFAGTGVTPSSSPPVDLSYGPLDDSIESIQTPDSVLVFSKTAGFRHRSIPAGVRAMIELGKKHAFHVHATESPAAFTLEHLKSYGVVVFLNTTGDVLNDSQQEALRTYIENGGGFVGIHSAADTEHSWSWYGHLVGAYYRNHSQVVEGTVRIERNNHPSTRKLPSPWIRRDEWYNYASNPRQDVQVLATIDESTYRGGEMGDDHPISWKHQVKEGRAWYTGMGHTIASFSEPPFLNHILGGIHWASRTETRD